MNVPEKTPHILIEKMIFGDYRVCVWDENLSMMLDKNYFCRGILSARLTAVEVQNDLFPELKIYEHDIEFSL